MSDLLQRLHFLSKRGLPEDVRRIGPEAFDELSRLRSENERLRDLCSSCKGQVEEGAARIAELENALARFGVHRNGCVWKLGRDHGCTCGLNAALSQAEGKSNG